MKKGGVIGFLFCLVTLLAFKKPASLFVIPKGWPKPVYDFKRNPLTAEKIELGRTLFYDPILSRDSTISCASCHLQYTAFTHVDHDLSHGIEGRIGTRNSPALANLAWVRDFMWDGAVNHLDVQALAPIANPLEMDESIAHVVEKLQATSLYPELFYKAFGDSAITGEHVLQSISQFMLILVSADSKYDKVKRGEAAFNEQEANGYLLFLKNCATCHTEPLFTNGQFENNGLAVDETLNDAGRIKVVHKPGDSLKFKVPTLRNIEFSYPYMHDGRFKKLSQVLNHYSGGIVQTATLSEQLSKPILLSSNEKVELTAFLLTLTDKAFLFNPSFSPPVRKAFLKTEGIQKK